MNPSLKLFRPWELGNRPRNEDLSKNLAAIKQKLKEAQKEFKLNSPVRIRVTTKLISKASTQRLWSEEVYFVASFRTPLLSREPVCFKLKDSNGKILKGIFYSFELKSLKTV